MKSKCCKEPNINVLKLNSIGHVTTLNLQCDSCGKKFKWDGSSKVDGSGVYQVNLASQLSAQFAHLSYKAYARLFAYLGVKPLSEEKFNELNIDIWKKSTDICNKILKKKFKLRY